ncbi:hypothetical protein Tco_0384119, partial [Tanacetum coccineum]
GNADLVNVDHANADPEEMEHVEMEEPVLCTTYAHIRTCSRTSCSRTCFEKRFKTEKTITKDPFVQMEKTISV